MSKQRLVMPYRPHAHSEDSSNDSFPERHNSPRDIDILNSLQRCVDDTPEFLDRSEYLESRDSFRHQYGSANDFNIPNIGIDAERTHAHDLQLTISPHAFDERNSSDFLFLRGMKTYGEGPRNDFRGHEEGRCDADLPLTFDCRYDIPSQSPSPYFIHSESAMPSHVQSSKKQPVRAGKTTWTPFQGMFNSSASARNFRKAALRFDRQPYRPPDSDPTIWQIENERERWAKAIYDAMVCPDAAKDNPKSNAMRRWVEEPFYESALVESYAHRILDALLDQAKEGFRGWKHDDYTQDERKGEIEDTQVSCEERLRNVIKALEEEKTICEDVMASACQIRMFVNAPKAYAGRKLNNRVGNSKRKRAQDPPRMNEKAEPEEASRRAKSRKLPVRSSARKPRPATSGSDLLPRVGEYSSTTQPIFQEQDLAPHYSTTPQRLLPSPTLSYNAPNTPQILTSTERYFSTTGSSLGHQLHMAAVSPPQPHVQPIDIPHTPRITSMPPQHESPFMSPPQLSHFSASAPVTPEQPQTVNTREYPWQRSATFGHALDATLFNADVIDPSLFPSSWNWSEFNPSCSSPGQEQIQFDPQLFSPALLEPSESASFQQMWSSLSGGQGFPKDSSSQLNDDMSGQ